MAFIQYLNFNGRDLPLPISYDLDMKAIEADTTGETEAGTTQRDVVRQGVVTINVSFQVAASWLKRLSIYAKEDKLTVRYFDTTTLEISETEMYITGYKVKLEKDTSQKSLWSVSFTLNEF